MSNEAETLKASDETRKIVSNPELISRCSTESFGTQVFNPRTKEGRNGLRKALAERKQFYDEAGISPE